MRWKTTILLIYILGLFLVPCSDVYNNCSDSKSYQKEVSHNHSEDHDDHCTPFCQCSCCSVSVVKFSFKMPEFNFQQLVVILKKIVIKDCQIISRYSGSIWEPPKIFA